MNINKFIERYKKIIFLYQLIRQNIKLKCDKRPSAKYRQYIINKIDYLAFRLKNKMIFHIAAPKSGSSWLVNMIEHTKLYEKNTLVPDYGRREQEICLDTFPCLLRSFLSKKKFYIPHLHICASKFTINIIEKLNMKIIFQTRNIFDSVISMRDHLIKESNILAMAHIPEEFLDMPPEEQIDMIIELIVPWYIKFYASWFEYLKVINKQFYILTYENLNLNTKNELDSLFTFLEIENKSDLINKIIMDSNRSPHETRKNVGTLGRGDLLTNKQKTKIIKLTTYYKNIDFKLIGIN